jgi:photosystem II stability/assembly factor-like uncharacterized protein
LTPYIQPTQAILPTLPPTPFPGQLKPGQPVRIVRINMLNITSGWAIGQVETDLNDHILFTLDGGRTWRDATPPEALVSAPAQGLAATAFFGADGDAWVTYSGQLPSSPVPEKLVIWHSNDNGTTWQAAGELGLIGVQAEYFIPAELGFLNQQQGWLLAHVGAGMSHDYIVGFLTTDGGKTWTRVIDPQKNPELMSCEKTGFAFSTTTNGWLVGNCPGLLNHLFLYVTSDGGKTWQQSDPIPPAGQDAASPTWFT